MVRCPFQLTTFGHDNHLTELETCIKILKYLPSSEHPAMLDRINHESKCLSQLASELEFPGSESCSEIRNQQQLLSTIERLVSAGVLLEIYADEPANIQPLIQQHMDLLDEAWLFSVHHAEENCTPEAPFAGLRRNEGKQRVPSHKAALPSMKAARKEENQHQFRRSETATKVKSFSLTAAKLGPHATDNYVSNSQLDYNLAFDAEAHSYTVQETISSITSVKQSEKLCFHVNAIRSVDHKAPEDESLRVDVILESGKEVSLVFEKKVDRMVFLGDVYRCCPELE